MKRIGLAIMLTIWGAVLAGCGGGNSTSSPSGGASGSSATCPSGGGTGTVASSPHVSIGSKTFAEEQLLATITKQVLEKHAFVVDFSLQADDTAIGRAVLGGQIDMLWQYTGTELALPGYLNLSDYPRALDAAFAFVKQKDEPRGLCWTAPAPMNDTNGLAIKVGDKGKYGATLSDFGTYLAAHPETKVCILSAFRTRPDGLPGLVSKYNASYGNANLIDTGTKTAERNITNGDCAAGEVFTTDSGIAANNLYVLSDDKNLFPPDNVGLIVRSSTLQAHPEIGSIMAPVAAKITSTEITKLNKQVEIDNQKLDDVARAWLQTNGFL